LSGPTNDRMAAGQGAALPRVVSKLFPGHGDYSQIKAAVMFQFVNVVFDGPAERPVQARHRRRAPIVEDGEVPVREAAGAVLFLEKLPDRNLPGIALVKANWLCLPCMRQMISRWPG